MEGKENLQDKTIPCAYCQGKGRERGSSMACVVCKGGGVNVVSATYDDCGSCSGKGRKNLVTALYCLDCRGRGVISQNKITQTKHEAGKNLDSHKKGGDAKSEASWLKRFINGISVQEN